jgi:hypothetical protein
MAYILGFWFADGCITKGRIFSIKQHKNDIYLLDKINKEMQSTYPIRQENNSCCFEINSKIIYDDIINLGGKERKSLDVEFPDVPKKYLPDFIRGYFDGDGTISEGRMSKNGSYCGYKAAICSGSKGFISKFKNILEENIPGISIIYYEHKTIGGTVSIRGRVLENDGIVYRLSFSPNNLRKLRDFMYSDREDELRLIRKYEKFIDAGEYKPGPGDINYMPFEDAKNLMSSKNFRSIHDYHKWIKSSDCQVILPASPNVVYKEWNGWSDFLGHNRISYVQLSNMAKENGIKNRKSYWKWIKSIRENSWGKYPRQPQTVYKEWVNWDKFLQRV